MSDLEQLRALGHQLRRPAFDEIVETRRRRTRQSRVFGMAALCLAAVAVAGVLTSTGQANRTDPPPSGPSHTPSGTPEEGLDIPSGQQTIVPEIAPADVRGFDVLATLTNTQPEHAGDSELSTTVPTRNGTAYVEVYCRGTEDLYYFYDREDGAGGYGRCAPDADTTLTARSDIPDEAMSDPAVPLSMRMWIARPSAAYLDCVDSGTPDCGAVLGEPTPVADPDAQFGFGVYEHRPSRVLRLFQRDYDAVATADNIAWLLDRAVIAAVDADHLALVLPESEEGRLVDVYQAASPHFDRCVTQHRDELPDYETTQSADYWAAVDAVCGVTLRLVVDGSTVVPDEGDPIASGHFTELGYGLSQGSAHRVEVRVLRGDPRNVRYAVVVRTRTDLP
jgi:hypothetical protein